MKGRLSTQLSSCQQPILYQRSLNFSGKQGRAHISPYKLMLSRRQKMSENYRKFGSNFATEPALRPRSATGRAFCIPRDSFIKVTRGVAYLSSLPPMMLRMRQYPTKQGLTPRG